MKDNKIKPLKYTLLLASFLVVLVPSHSVFGMEEVRQERQHMDFASAWEQNFSAWVSSSAILIFKLSSTSDRLNSLEEKSQIYFQNLSEFINKTYPFSHRARLMLYYSGIKFYLDRLMEVWVNHGSSSLSNISRSCRTLLG